MRLIIDNGAYTLRNMGDVAMLQVTLERARRIFPRAEFFVLTSRPDLVPRYCPGALPLSAESRNAAYFPGPLPRRRPWKEFWRGVRGKHVTRPPNPDEFRAALATSDGVLVAGGGFLNDLNAHMTHAVLRMLAEAQANRKPVALFGQGLGPLRDPGLLSALRSVLEKGAWISLREGLKGPEIVSRALASPAKMAVTGDDAIAAACREPSSSSRPGSCIGLSIRQIAYSGIEDTHLKRITKALNFLRVDLSAEPVPVPVSFNSFEDDASAIARVTEIPVDSGAIDDPQAVIQSAAKARMVLTGTYHAAVFALSQGIPCVCFHGSPYYYDKLRGLQSQFGEGCVLVDLCEHDSVDILRRESQRLWTAAPALHDELCATAKKQVRASEAFYERALGDFQRG